MDSRSVTPEMARRELAKRELERRKSSSGNQTEEDTLSGIPGYAISAALDFPSNIAHIAGQVPSTLSYMKQHPVLAARDLAGGFGNMFQKIGASGLELGEAATRKLPQRFLNDIGSDVKIPKWNAREFAGLGEKNPFSLGKAIASEKPDPLLYNLIPQLFGAASFGVGAVPVMAASALTAASQAEPGKRISAATEGAVNAGIPIGIGKGYKSARNMMKGTSGTKGTGSEFIPPEIRFSPDQAGSSEWGANPAEFGNTETAYPEFLSPEKPQVSSENISRELAHSISGGRNLEETGKQLASHAYETYQPIESRLKNRYNSLFDSDTGHENIFTGEPFRLKEMRIDNGKYKSSYHDAEIPDSNISMLHSEYINNPTIENAHRLQSELGSEIGYLKKQFSDKKLDSNGKNVLKKYVEMRETLKNDIHDEMKSLDPRFEQEYRDTTSEWEREILPWHSEKDLKSIVTGKTKNPSVSQIKNIFMNPEENMKRVTSHLGQKGRDYISYLGMGKTSRSLNAKGLLAGRENLENSGLSSYLSPQHEQMMSALEKNVSHEAEIEKINRKNEAIRQQLESARKKSSDALESARKKREAGYQTAARESQQKHEAYKKQMLDLQAELKRQEKMKKDRVKNFIRAGVGGILGSKLGGRLGGVEGEVIGGILGSEMVKKGKDILK
jgi:hypothetical protein